MNKTQSTRHRKIKELLQDIEINPPKVDYLTNSKNIEFSIYNKALDVGGSIEADIIHEEKSMIPVYLRNRLDANLFGKDLNIFEWGIRTEGLQDILQKLIALKDKIPKFEKIRDRLAQKPTLEEIKDEFNYLSPNKVFGDTKAELSMYFRTMGTEIFDISTSDLSGMKKMLKMAELMSKLAHGERADFSHSVVLVNSKLAIPSVTGRSYSIDLVGSSTVGVTAEIEAFFLQFLRDANFHFHFQPSLNLQFSTYVGIPKGREDFKVVSRWHIESDVDVRFEVKDGHAVLARLTPPSKNIASFNMSTLMFEIDEKGNEIAIFEEIHKKTEHCSKNLQKPLGVTVCSTVESPQPFVSRKIPFGNGAIALKKSDNSIKSYEFRFAIPQQAGASMEYNASFETPGSNVSRRFEADLEVKQDRDRKYLLLKFVSPFTVGGGNCSFKKNDKLIEGYMELHTNETQIASARITSKIRVSKSSKIYEVKGACSIRNQDRSLIYGTVTVIKGSKERISIDFKTKELQPMTLKAIIIKEGRIEFSEKSEWKLSSKVSLATPIVSLNFRNTLEKQPKRPQLVSGKIALEYSIGRPYERHIFTTTVTITSTVTLSQGSNPKISNKVSTDVKVQSTQYPRGNMHLTWDMQRESQESLTNDIKLTNGQKPYKTYFHFKQKYRMPKTGPGHCSVTIEIPQRDIHYELSLTHDINISEQRRINIEADLCYKQDKHIKSSVDVKYESLSPFKAAGKLELEYPGGHYIYEDEFEETSGLIV